MKKIGRGWQYTTYDLDNGRVFKRYNTWLEAYTVMLKDSILHLRPPVINFSHYYIEGRDLALRSLAEISKRPLELWMFGNPRIVGKYEYEQDYVEPLASCMKSATTENGMRIVEKFITFTKLLLEHSLIERNFNVGDNFGLNHNGDVILIDIGEILFVQSEIKVQLAKRVWAASDVLSRIPSHLREYFIKQMDKAFLSE